MSFVVYKLDNELSLCLTSLNKIMYVVNSFDKFLYKYSQNS